jgi:hypothetical protein
MPKHVSAEKAQIEPTDYFPAQELGLEEINY